MAEAESAVMDPPVTGAPAEATEAFAPAESEQPGIAADPEGEPETTDSVTEVESPLAGKPLEEVENDPIVKELLEKKLQAKEASVRESERQRRENEIQAAREQEAQQQYHQRLQATSQQAQANLANGFLSEVSAAAKRYEKGEADSLEVSPQRVSQYLAQADMNGRVVFTQAIYDRANAWLSDPENGYGGMQFPPEFVRNFEAAKAQTRPDALLDAWTNIVAAGEYQRLHADPFKGMAEEQIAQLPAVKSLLAKVASGELAVEGVKAAVRTRAERPGPTNVSGGSAAGLPTTMGEADAAYNANRITHEQYKQYRERFELGSNPGGKG